MEDGLQDGENLILRSSKVAAFIDCASGQRVIFDQGVLLDVLQSQIETGKREGTIKTFKKIAAALRVEIDDIA